MSTRKAMMDIESVNKKVISITRKIEKKMSSEEFKKITKDFANWLRTQEEFKFLLDNGISFNFGCSVIPNDLFGRFSIRSNNNE